MVSLKLFIFLLASINITFVTSNSCSYHLTETIPDGVYFDQGPHLETTYSGIRNLLRQARSSINIASFYWTLKCNDTLNPIAKSCSVGEEILTILKDSAKRGVKVEIAVDSGQVSKSMKNVDSDINDLINAGAKVRNVDFKRLLGAGVLHTKFIIVDEMSFYIGSANMDWRSLTQVKELGIIVDYCQDLAADLMKIFKIYWKLGKESNIPSQWPLELTASYNISAPLTTVLSGINTKVFFTSSPKPLNALYRTNDIDAIIRIINVAKDYINIAVMDFAPYYLYSKEAKFWPLIDDAIRRAVFERNVKVKILHSLWPSTRKNQLTFLRSLNKLGDKISKGSIEVKLFKVPSDSQQKKIPHARVNHNKYMVSDNNVLIGTSNWSADYFNSTGGVSFVANFNPNKKEDNMVTVMKSVFQRDWTSSYATSIEDPSIDV